MELNPSFMKDLVRSFESEARELVESVTQDLLSIEKGGLGGDGLAKTYAKICRNLHTLKGSAATCGLGEVSRLAHGLEDVVAPFKAGAQVLPSDTVDLLFQGMDMLLGRIHIRATQDAPPAPGPDWDSLAAQLESAQASSTAPEAPAPPKGEGTMLPEEEGVEKLDLEGGWKVEPRQVLRMMQEVERLRELKLRLADQSRKFGRALQNRPALESTGAAVGGEDILFALRHELVFDAEEAASLVDSLEESLKDISMLSLDTIALPLHRLVRDLCRTLGKQAALSVTGGEILLDRGILEGLKGPLVHLVRNALDHGLEFPDQRDAAGKHREGALVVRAEQQGNLLFLEVSDDGRGIDPEKIRQQAAKRQLFSREELDAMGEAQLRQILFHSGFSTREEVTSISGRGVGLDAVKAAVQALKGTVEIVSKPGQGTRFILTLPVELGSSPVLILRVGAHHFGLPMLSVQSILRAHPEALRLSQDRWELEYEGRRISLKDLGELLRTRLSRKPQPGQPILLIPLGDRELALTVDEVMGDESLALHPLPPEFANVGAFQGVGLLASGELVPVLRTGWLGQWEDRGDPFKGRLKALVVDDSLTARAMHRNMLESGGYLVHGASSARQALDLIQSSAYDVVLCDIGMEDMDGLAFTRALKADPRTRHLPVILVSAHDQEKDVQGYLASGADAFLGKKDCGSGRLLAEVANVLKPRGGAHA